MENTQLDNKATVLRSASSDLLDSRTPQQREAEKVKGRIAIIYGECWIGGHTFDLEAFADKLVAERREAIEAEREACARIAYGYPRESFNPVTDKLSPTWHIGELISRRK